MNKNKLRTGETSWAIKNELKQMLAKSEKEKEEAAMIEKATKEGLKNGDLTDKGIVKMADKPFIDRKTGELHPRLIITTQGAFRETDLTFMEKAPKELTPIKDNVDFNTVMSVDIRPGRVTEAKRVPKTDKLIELSVKTAFGMKKAVTNLGDTFKPEDFNKKTFMFVFNMPPMKMKGVKSELMIVANTYKKLNEAENVWEDKVKLMEVNLPLDSTIL